jgi:maleate isomerase
LLKAAEGEVGMISKNAIERSDNHWFNDQDFGRRARLGLITPSRGWTPEHEWPRMLPRGVSYMVARMPLKSTTPDELRKMGQHAVDAAHMLASAEVDVIAYGCTVETILQGLEYDRAVEKRLSEAAGTPARTMTGAVMAALRALEVSKLALVTPYIEEINQKEIAFMKNIGIEIVYEKGLSMTDTIEIAKVKPETVYDLGKMAAASAPQAEAIFISCGNLRTLEVLQELENEIGKPVISSNQALLWSSLRLAGITDTLNGFGSLFEK